MSFQSTALLLAWVAIAVLGLALSGLLRQIGILRSGLAPIEGALSIAQLPAVPELAPKRAQITVALFSDPGCASCSRLVPVFEALAAKSDSAEFAVLTPGQGNGIESDRVTLLQDQQRLFEKLHIPVTPFAIAVNADGSIRESTPVGSPLLLESFVRDMINGGQQ